MIDHLRQIVEGRETPAAWAFDVTVQVLIVLSLISFPLETLPNLPDWAYWGLRTFEAVSVTIFTIEYLLRILVAEDRIGFIFSFYGLVDLLAILPFYISAGADFRAIRAVRLFRLLRLLKLARYTDAVSHFARALRSIREELVLFSIMSVLFIYLASSGIYYFEQSAQPGVFKSIPHSIWWAVATLTTVGYGDVYPVTVGGKIFTAIVLLIGLGIVAVPTGLLANALSEVTEKREENESTRD